MNQKRKLAVLRQKRDAALVEADISRRMGRSGNADLRKAFLAAIAIDKTKGLYLTP